MPAARAASSREAPSSTRARASIRREAAASRHRLASRRSSTAPSSFRVIATVMTPPPIGHTADQPRRAPRGSGRDDASAIRAVGISGDLVVPKGIELAFLSPHTPELQPAEHLWPLADEAVATKHFTTLEDLDAALGERCRTLADMPEVIKAATHFAWWPAVTPPSSPAH